MRGRGSVRLCNSSGNARIYLAIQKLEPGADVPGIPVRVGEWYPDELLQITPAGGVWAWAGRDGTQDHSARCGVGLMNIERRYVELRQGPGRTLEGVAVVYGDHAKLPWGITERIEPGAFQPLGDVILNAHHNRAAPLARTGGGLTLVDTPERLAFSAELPKHPRCRRHSDAGAN